MKDDTKKDTHEQLFSEWLSKIEFTDFKAIGYGVFAVMYRHAYPGTIHEFFPKNAVHHQFDARISKFG